MNFDKACFVLGNGPSLADVRNYMLDMLPTFGTNRIYLKYTPTFYVCVNDLIARQSLDEISKLTSMKFITERVAIPGAFQLHSGPPCFSTDITKEVYEGGTVTYVALQIAFSLGYRNVYLLGVDHSYVSPGEPNAEVKWTGADINHFDSSYMLEGEAWNCPDLYSSEIAYGLAKEAYEANGGKIINLTHGTKLDVFDKMNFYDFYMDLCDIKFSNVRT